MQKSNLNKKVTKNKPGTWPWCVLASPFSVTLDGLPPIVDVILPVVRVDARRVVQDLADLVPHLGILNGVAESSLSNPLVAEPQWDPDLSQSCGCPLPSCCGPGWLANT